ncbi:hypothetical protein GBA52_008986 [Prunus armeniaca]|nr:hypothetical protein GBA52_008986 [Prunus armeniaca]
MEEGSPGVFLKDYRVPKRSRASDVGGMDSEMMSEPNMAVPPSADTDCIGAPTMAMEHWIVDFHIDANLWLCVEVLDIISKSLLVKVVTVQT